MELFPSDYKKKVKRGQRVPGGSDMPVPVKQSNTIQKVQFESQICLQWPRKLNTNTETHCEHTKRKQKCFKRILFWTQPGHTCSQFVTQVIEVVSMYQLLMYLTVRSKRKLCKAVKPGSTIPGYKWSQLPYHHCIAVQHLAVTYYTANWYAELGVMQMKMQLHLADAFLQCNLQ